MLQTKSAPKHSEVIAQTDPGLIFYFLSGADQSSHIRHTRMSKLTGITQTFRADGHLGILSIGVCILYTVYCIYCIPFVR